MAELTPSIEDVLFNPDILECILGHLYHPDAVRVWIAQDDHEHG